MDPVSLLVALVVATGMWYAVTRMDSIEAEVEIGLDYVGTPPNFVVTEGLVGRAKVRLRGSSTMLRSVLSQNLSVPVSLADIRKGETLIPLEDKVAGPWFKHLAVVEIQPAKIEVRADMIAERTLPLRQQFVLEMPGAMKVEIVAIEPSEVTVRGPEKEVSRLSHVRVSVPVDLTMAGRVTLPKLLPTLPPFVTSTPSTVSATFTVDSPRTQATLRRRVNLQVEDRRGYTVEPAEIEVDVEVPTALAKRESYISRFQIRATPPPAMTPGVGVEVPVALVLPEGMVELRKSAYSVTVTKKETSSRRVQDIH
jgi:hypothetical protein